MSVLSATINTALSGANAYQTAIDITSTNIANAGTEEYSRQTVTLTANQQTVLAGRVVGGGVSVASVNRINDTFTTKLYLSTNDESGKYEAEEKYVSSLEALFNGVDDAGLSNALSDFWDSWDDLANNASGSNERTILVGEVQSLVYTLNQMSEDLDSISDEIESDMAAYIEEINDLTSRIAELNKQIANLQALGNSTNTLEDSREALLVELSSLVDFSYQTNDNGTISIQLSDGTPLVNGSTSYTLGLEMNTTTGLQDVTWSDSSGNVETVTSSITSGRLGGAIEVYSTVIPEYQEQLDEIASTLITEINNLLLSGYDLEGNAGTALFTGTDASDITVNTLVQDNPDLIAAAATSDSAPGDGAIAAAIAELQNSLLMNGGTTSIDDFYITMVTDIGNLSQSVEENYDYQSDLAAMYANYRESISGVNVDEETAKLVTYQTAYEACLKVISIIDEMMDSIINL